MTVVQLPNFATNTSASSHWRESQRLLQFSAGSRGEFLRPEYFNFKVFCLVSSTANSVKTFGHRTLLLPLPPKLICSRMFEVCERDYVRHCCLVLAHQ